MNSWWWTDELSETCRVSWQNKIVKLVHLVGFITKKFVTMHGRMNVKTTSIFDIEYILYRLMQRYRSTNSFRGSSEPVFTGKLDILNELSCRFTHILHENTGIIISRLRKIVFLTNPFQFTLKTIQFNLTTASQNRLEDTAHSKILQILQLKQLDDEDVSVIMNQVAMI
jgi:hypothetical protein